MQTMIQRLIKTGTFQTLFLMQIRGSSLVVKFALTLFIAKFMNFEVLGFYGLVATATIMAPSFLGLSLMYIISRHAVTQTLGKITEELQYYIRFILWLYGIVTCIALIIGFCTGQIFLSLTILAIIIFEHINQDIYALLLNLSKPITANILHAIRTAVWMLIFMILAFFLPEFQTIEALLLFWIGGSVISLLGFMIVTKDWPWRTSGIKEPLLTWLANKTQESKTVYATGFINTFDVNIGSYLITFFLGLELTGVYVFFMQIISAMGNLIQTGVIQITRPKIVYAFKEKTSDYKELYIRCLKNTGLTAAAMSIVAIPTIYIITHHIIDKPLVVEWFPIFWGLLTIFIVWQIKEVNYLIFYSQHKDDLILKITLIITVFSFILKTTLIIFFSLWGLVIATFLTAVATIIMQQRLIREYFKLV